jgi:hypothetical protein
MNPASPLAQDRRRRASSHPEAGAAVPSDRRAPKRPASRPSRLARPRRQPAALKRAAAWRRARTAADLPLEGGGHLRLGLGPGKPALAGAAAPDSYGRRRAAPFRPISSRPSAAPAGLREGLVGQRAAAAGRTQRTVALLSCLRRADRRLGLRDSRQAVALPERALGQLASSHALGESAGREERAEPAGAVRDLGRPARATSADRATTDSRFAGAGHADREVPAICSA